MTVALFLFGVLVTAIATIGILSVGVSEATDEAHGRADDAFTELERKVSEQVR